MMWTDLARIPPYLSAVDSGESSERCFPHVCTYHENIFAVTV